MFFKRNAPIIADYDKTKSDLLRLGWLVEIYDAESNKSIYVTFVINKKLIYIRKKLL